MYPSSLSESTLTLITWSLIVRQDAEIVTPISDGPSTVYLTVGESSVPVKYKTSLNVSAFVQADTMPTQNIINNKYFAFISFSFLDIIFLQDSLSEWPHEDIYIQHPYDYTHIPYGNFQLLLCVGLPLYLPAANVPFQLKKE